LQLNNQGVDNGRIALLHSSVREHLADFIFFGTLALAGLVLTVRTKFLERSFDFSKKIANPYVVVLAIVFVPSLIGIRWPGIISSYFMNIFGIGHLYPNFGDLRGLFSGISNVRQVGERIPCYEGECVPTTWIYGRILLSLPAFHASDLLIIAMSLLLTILVISQVNGLIEKENRWQLSLVIATPPFVLLIERQNIEILIALLTIWAAVCYQQEKYLLSIIAISIGTLIKFYPIILSVFFLAKYVPLLTRLQALCVFTIVTIFIIPDISVLQGRATPGLAATFGLRNVLPWLDYPFGSGRMELNSWISLIFLVLSIFFTSLISYRAANVHISTFSNKSILVFIFSSTVAIFAWLANSNYAYRAIFFIIPMLLLGQITNNTYVKAISWAFYMFSVFLSTSFALQRNLAFAFLASILIGINFSIASRELSGKNKFQMRV
jgi:hypothetical protein